MEKNIKAVEQLQASIVEWIIENKTFVFALVVGGFAFYYSVIGFQKESEARFLSLANRQTQAIESIEALHSDFRNFQLDGVRERAALDLRVERIESSIARLADRVEDLRVRIGSKENEVEKLARDLSALAARIDEIRQ